MKGGTHVCHRSDKGLMRVVLKETDEPLHDSRLRRSSVRFLLRRTRKEICKQGKNTCS